MSSAAPSPPTELSHTPLRALHAELGARFTEFAGYEMPVQYPAGVMAEHRATRASAGLFDVGHMGQITLRARSGVVDDAARALERLVPTDVLGLAPGRQRYALLTTPEGGILDDLMIARRDDHLHLVVNAARKAADLAHLADALSDQCDVAAQPDQALIALQGPAAQSALAALAPEAAAMRFMDARSMTIDGVEAFVTRSGYTGEDGYEISLPAAAAEGVARALLSREAVSPVGLGARDSLRLEAGLCLHGSDIDADTTPVDADLIWSIGKARRPGGARAGGFAGAEAIFATMSDPDPTARRRVGLRPEGRAPVRAGAPLFEAEDAATPIGRVTSGGFGPSVGAPVAMGYLPRRAAEIGTRVFAEVRAKRLPVVVAPLPFVPHRYKRA